MRFAIADGKDFLTEGYLDLPHLKDDAQVRKNSRIRFDSAIGHMNIALFMTQEKAEDHLSKVRETFPNGKFASEKVVPVAVEVRQIGDEELQAMLAETEARAAELQAMLQVWGTHSGAPIRK